MGRRDPAKLAYKLTDRVLHPSVLERVNVSLAAAATDRSTSAAAADTVVRRRIKVTEGWRSVGAGAIEDMGIGAAAFEEWLMVTLPSWEVPEGITIATDINSPVRRSDSEVVRRAAAERHLETLPTPTVTIWSDSSADSGTANGGGGAAIYLADGSEHAFRVPAGVLQWSWDGVSASRPGRADPAGLHRHQWPRPGLCRLPVIVGSAAGRPGGSAIGDRRGRLAVPNGDGERRRAGPPATGTGTLWPAKGNELADALTKEASELPQQNVPPDAAAVVKPVARDTRRAWAPASTGTSWKARSRPQWKTPTAAQPWTTGSVSAPGRPLVGLPAIHAQNRETTNWRLRPVRGRWLPGRPHCGLPEGGRHPFAALLLRCPALWWRRRRLLGDPPDCHGLQDSGVVANLASGYRALQSLLMIDPAGRRNNNNNIRSQLSDKRRKLSGGKQV